MMQKKRKTAAASENTKTKTELEKDIQRAYNFNTFGDRPQMVLNIRWTAKYRRENPTNIGSRVGIDRDLFQTRSKSKVFNIEDFTRDEQAFLINNSVDPERYGDVGESLVDLNIVCNDEELCNVDLNLSLKDLINLCAAANVSTRDICWDII